jgi:predicted metal-dependent phosphoesterase TrpH
MLGYGFEPGDERFVSFLQRQRESRVQRARLIAERLALLGVPIDLDAAIERARPTTISRPIIAQAMADAGHAASRRDAFDRYLAAGGLAYVPRLGASPADVVALVRRCGGVVSMAHPGVTAMDHLIAPLAEAGMAGLEVFHSDHDEAAIARYSVIARDCGLAMTGGSDFHGTDDCGRELGAVSLPPEHFAAFLARG